MDESRQGLGVPLSPTRNPYRGKGLRITWLLLREPRPWSVTDIAARAGVSQPMASLVLRRLRLEGLIDEDIVQGRAATVRGTRRLAEQAALHWPRPRIGVQGPIPQGGPIGGGPAHRAVGLTTAAPPIRYVRSRQEATELLAAWGGAPVSLDVAEYQICVADVELDEGLVPRLVVALELGGTPRGRETLRAHIHELLGDLRP